MFADYVCKIYAIPKINHLSIYLSSSIDTRYTSRKYAFLFKQFSIILFNCLSMDVTQ